MDPKLFEALRFYYSKEKKQGKVLLRKPVSTRMKHVSLYILYKRTYIWAASIENVLLNMRIIQIQIILLMQ